MFEASDAFVTLPGGIGTLEEVIEIMTWAQLGQPHQADRAGQHQGLLGSAFDVDRSHARGRLHPHRPQGPPDLWSRRPRRSCPSDSSVPPRPPKATRTSSGGCRQGLLRGEPNGELRQCRVPVDRDLVGRPAFDVVDITGLRRAASCASNRFFATGSMKPELGPPDSAPLGGLGSPRVNLVGEPARMLVLRDRPCHSR